MSLMGIDVGTTGARAVAFREDGKVLCQSYREYSLLNPGSGYYELQPEKVWLDVAACLQAVNACEAVRADPVKALAVSSQGEAVIPISREGFVLANSPVSSDSRGIPQAARLAQILGPERIYEITGQPVDALYSLPKILWWADHTPDLFARTWKFLCYGDFVNLRLCGEAVIDYTMAARTLGFDIRGLEWSAEILEKVGLDESRFAGAKPSGMAISTVTRRAAQELGFQPGVLVVSGGHDQPCAALGAGVTQPAEAMYSIGTTECVAPVLPRPLAALQKLQQPCYPHVVPGRYIVITGSQTGGRLLRWYRDEWAGLEKAEAERSGKNAYDLITSQAGPEPTNLIVLAHFAGSGTALNDPASKGAIYGLSFDTQRGEIIKAILEGITYEQAVSVRGLRQSGVEIRRLRAVGGGSRSPIWLQIKADILDLPITSMGTDEAASMGAAMLAGWAAGEFPSLEEAASRWVKEKEEYLPDRRRAAIYQQRLKQYEALYQALKGFQPSES